MRHCGACFVQHPAAQRPNLLAACCRIAQGPEDALDACVRGSVLPFGITCLHFCTFRVHMLLAQITAGSMVPFVLMTSA